MIVLIDYGAGNTASVSNALGDLGVTFKIVKQLEELPPDTEKIILPGVGEASSAMRKLRATGLIETIRNTKLPFLGICLGMQLLFEKSEEGSTECLGVLPGETVRFLPEHGKIPHMGWNRVKGKEGSILFKDIPESSFFYFAHSYYVPVNRSTSGYCEYGIEFTAAVNKDNFYGVQFHPEKSGRYGLKVLENFIRI